MSDPITAVQFLEEELVPSLRRMIECEFTYYVFPLASESFEIMGAFYDTKEFSQRNMSEERATKALKKFFKNVRNRKYSNNQKFIYENLRCGFAHLMRPGSKILVGALKDGDAESDHWKNIDGDKIILIAECLIDDIEKAIGNLKVAIEKKSDGIDLDKALQVYIDRDA